MIDLHTHTCASDGTLSPSELIQAAVDAGLEALGITDHDTFAGYEAAVSCARAAALDLVCGIELNTRFGGRTVHLLVYFPVQAPSAEFSGWVTELQATRRDRNARLIASLQSFGLDVTLAEVENLGRSLAGRPHFARLLVQKGYAASTQDAFEKYLGHTAQTYVERDSPTTEDAIRRGLAGGGVPVVAHPIRLGKRNPREEEAFIGELREAGLPGLEAYHSDHGPADVARYLDIARRHGMLVTGGSDFHGDVKPNIRLGTGMNGNLAVPKELLDRLRELQ